MILLLGAWFPIPIPNSLIFAFELITNFLYVEAHGH